MKIIGLIWLDQYVEKLLTKHGVAQYEVEDIFYRHPRIEKAGRGHVQGENLYRALGQTEDGRYLIVIFIFKPSEQKALVISARDMDRKERKRYGR
ncbi:MAG: BrnT family toxin [Anaerolineae bacterium]|nr:BrnT family toxin [Anaerolineae bacterium]